MKGNISEFIANSYKSKEIIFPSAIARMFDINIKEAYEELEKHKVKYGNIRNLYMITCPYCSRTLLNHRFYSMSEIGAYMVNNNDVIYCENCDAELDKGIVSCETNVSEDKVLENTKVYYEKL